MRLKNINIFGFKSFADRTDIDVDGDLVAVVGPNGCGKSNIVDALLWGLGEPTARSLRAQTSAEVIFSGSAKRKPIGYAEVSLVFENEDGALPVSTSEVVVTRRLDKKGESAFYINRHACRLKDIHELFADSGLGRTGYAVVSQSEIDAALSAPPTERRVWLDEAAGVQRYRTRKVEALKRLESALQHLQRVTDVINEIELQREPLRGQAESARLYKQALESLRDVESGLLIRESGALADEVAALEASLADKRSQADRMRRDAEEAEAGSAGLARQVTELEATLDALRNDLQTTITAVERAETKRALAEQRLASLDEIEAGGGREEEHSRARLERAKHAAEAADREWREAQKAVEVLLKVISGSADEARRIGQELEAAESKLAAARQAEIETVHLQARLAQAEERRKALGRELEGAEQALPGLRSGESDAGRSLDEAKRALEDARGDELRLAEAREALSAKLRLVEQDQRRALAESAALEGRIQGLRATLDSFEALPAGARAVLEAAKAGQVAGDFLPVASALRVPARFAQAIEAALGASAGDLITSHSRHAKEAIALLKREGLGRATFLAADLLRPRPRPDGIEALLRKDALGVAADLVACDNEHKAAVELLLGGIVIVEDLDTATRLAGKPGYRKIATLEGDLVFPGGALTGGRSAKQAAGPIRLAAQVEEAENLFAELSCRVETLACEAEALTASEGRTVEDASEARRVIREREAAVAEAVGWATAVREERVATERAVARLKHEMEALEEFICLHTRRVEACFGSEARAETGKQPAPTAPSDVLEAERNRLLTLAAAGSADAEQARRALEDGREREAAAKGRLERAKAELEDALAQAAGRKTRLTSLEAERDSQRRRMVEAEAEIRSLAAARTENGRALKEAQERRQELLGKSLRSVEDEKRWREAARSLEDLAYKDDIQRARAETKRAGLLARLLEEYDVSEQEAVAQAGVVEVPPDADRLAARLRREIRALGEVNLGAIEAYERLTERYEILTTQREDILASKAELDKSVAELDRLTRGAFSETFEKVNEAFREMVLFLFDGGEAQLVLTDPENLLETGVEIEVQIPGKRRQRLELLSGGERALAACAFLFALLKVKPSPLVVLDELDAPLDGRNVERYVELLRRFSQESQFIVVTHNPTTIEAAPIWFGVTMQEPGVSTVIPYRAHAAALPSRN